MAPPQDDGLSTPPSSDGTAGSNEVKSPEDRAGPLDSPASSDPSDSPNRTEIKEAVKAVEIIHEKPTILAALERTRREVTKRMQKRFRELWKDIEIDRNEFTILLLIALSIGSIVVTTANYYVNYFSPQLLVAMVDLSVLGIGFLVGLVCAIFLVDLVTHRFRLIIFFQVLSTVTLGLYRLFWTSPSMEIVPQVLIGLDGFLIAGLGVFFITLVVEYTKVLERGRVTAIVVSVAGFISTGLFLLVAAGIELVALVFPVLTAIYLYLRRNREKIDPRRQATSRKRRWHQLGDRELNRGLLAYSIITLIFTFLAGTFVPLREFDQLVQQDIADVQIISFVTLVVFLGFVVAFLIGYVYDFIGRKFTLSLLILSLAFANFSRIFTFTANQNLLFMIISLVGLVIAVPLIVGDFSKPANYGKSVGLVFFLLVGGFLGGIVVQNFLDLQVTLNASALAIILILFILANTREKVSYKEASWPDKLNRLYVVHESGVLLFEHDFAHETHDVESDLVSGGIVGLITMLKEITRGKDQLRAIDHGDKKILFRRSGFGNVIFALIISEELVVLRKKLLDFSLAFQEMFKDKLARQFQGVMPEEWEAGARLLVQSCFERKFFPAFLRPEQTHDAPNGNNKNEE